MVCVDFLILLQKGASENTENKTESDASPFDDEFGFEPGPLTRVTHTAANDFVNDDNETITSVKCTKKDKEVRLLLSTRFGP